MAELKQAAPPEERVRGLWALELDAEESRFFEACRAVLADPAAPIPDDLGEVARTYVQARRDQPATAAHFRPVFDDAGRVGVLIRPDRHEWFAGGYVFAESTHALRVVDDQRVDVVLDGNTWHLAFEGVDRLELTDELGAFAWLAGHEGAISLRRAE